MHDGGDKCCISDLIKHATLTMLFKVVRGEAPEYLINILLDLNDPRNDILQNIAILRVPFSRLETYKKYFFPRAISLWNDLTVESQSKDSVDNFNKQFAV